MPKYTIKKEIEASSVADALDRENEARVFCVSEQEDQDAPHEVQGFVEGQ